MIQVIIQHSCATQKRRSVSHTSTHRVRCTLQLTLSLAQTYIMENTIRVKDHPLVALGNRNIQSQDEYNYVVYQEEMQKEYLDYMNTITPFVGGISFDDVDDNLPF